MLLLVFLSQVYSVLCHEVCLQRLKDCAFCSISVPDDLSIEEREELLNIRRRKKELIDDIEVTALAIEFLRRLLQQITLQ